jgi:hypothetical protein
MKITQLGNWTVSFMQVTGSTISGPHSAVLVGGDGAVAGLEESDAGESTPDCEAYGAPGIVFRPRAPEQVSTTDGTETIGAEAYAIRTGDGLTPFTWRDLRLNRAFPAPKPGSLALVGYAGGFVSVEDQIAPGGDESSPDAIWNSLITLYVPYKRSTKEGAPTKAHCIVLDPENEDVKIIQGDGASVLLSKDGAIVRSPNGASRIEISDDGIKLVGNVSVVGNMVVGIDPLVPTPTTAMVLAVGPGTPPLQPCLSLMVAVPPP